MQEIQALIEPQPLASPDIPSPWYVVLTVPQQEIPLVWRLHELGLELYTPIVRRRVKTGRIGRHGHKLTRVQPRPMFPGYGFVRQMGITDLNWIRDVRGVREFLKIKGDPVLLPHTAIMAVFKKQYEEHQAFMVEIGGRKSSFKLGDLVRVDDEGSVYSGLISRVEKVDGRGRVELLFGMIKHTLSADKLVAA